MGVKLYQLRFPSDSCKFNGSHHFTKVLGNIWRCKYCWASKYLPNSYGDALDFTIDINRKGLASAYQNLLKDKPNTVKVLETLRGIRMTRESSTEKVAQKLEQALVVSLAKDNKELRGVRKEMSQLDSNDGVASILDKVTSINMGSSGRRIPIMKGRS